MVAMCNSEASLALDTGQSLCEEMQCEGWTWGSDHEVGEQCEDYLLHVVARGNMMEWPGSTWVLKYRLAQTSVSRTSPRSSPFSREIPKARVNFPTKRPPWKWSALKDRF